MTAKKKMFYGIHIDTVVDEYNHEDEECERIVVKLDDEYHEFTEDPSDGYRSYCNMSVTREPPKNAIFSLEHTPIPVYVKESTHEEDIEELTIYRDEDCTTIVCRVGTNFSDHYYPYCYMRYNIEVINDIYTEAILLRGSDE